MKLKGIHIQAQYSLLIWGISTLLFSCLLLIGLSAGRSTFPGYLQAPVVCMGIGVLLILGVHLLSNFGSETKWKVSAHLLGLSGVATILWLFAGTDWGLGGNHADAWFNQSLVQQYARSWNSQDFAYKDLSSFYPFAWHFFLGKSAWLLGIQPFMLWKIGTLLVAWLLPVALFSLWKRIFEDPTAAFLIAAGTLLVLWQSDLLLYKTYEGLALALIIPWYWLFIEKAAPARNWKRLIIGGLSGALIFCTYYYYFLLLGLVFFLGKLIDLRQKGGKEGLGNWQRQLEMAAAVFLFSLPFLGPYLLSMLSGPVESLHTHWVLDSHLLAEGWLTYGAGIALLAFAWLGNRSEWAAFLLRLAASLLLFVLIGEAGIAFGQPLLFHKMNVFWLLLPVWIAPLLYLHFKQEKSEEGLRISRSYLPLTVAALLSFAMVLPMQESSQSEWYEQSFTTEVDSLAMDPDFQQVLRDAVVLTPDFNLNVFAPVYLFATPNAHYTHPCSQFRERLRFLALLQNYHNEDFLAWILNYNRFDNVDYVYLPDTSLMLFADDNFPDEQPAWEVPIPFPEAHIQSGSSFFKDFEGYEGLYRVRRMPFEQISEFNRTEQALIMLYGNEKAQDWFVERNPEGWEEIHYYESLLPQKLQDYSAKMDLFWMIFIEKESVKVREILEVTGDWTVYYRPPFLTYKKENFTPADREKRLYLHAFPKELWMLSEPKGLPYFSLDFDWKQASELIIDSTAWYRIRLPDAPLRRIETGQFYESSIRPGPAFVNVWGMEKDF